MWHLLHTSGAAGVEIGFCVSQFLLTAIGGDSWPTYSVLPNVLSEWRADHKGGWSGGPAEGETFCAVGLISEESRG